MLTHSTFTLPLLTARQKATLLRHAEQVLLSQQQMSTRRGKNILHYTLNKKRRHVRNTHYPLGDRIDKTNGSQYFYHCHRENSEREEHGHFHCFIRYPFIPKHIKPARLSDWDKYIHNPMTHLVAVAMNRYGQPIRLFSVNRWVSEEIWYDSKYSTTFINRFKMTLTDDPYWMVLDQWITALLKLFSPQIAWLQQQRDNLIQQQLLADKDNNPYNNRSFEELSEIPIDLMTQIQWIINAPIAEPFKEGCY